MKPILALLIAASCGLVVIDRAGAQTTPSLAKGKAAAVRGAATRPARAPREIAFCSTAATKATPACREDVAPVAPRPKNGAGASDVTVGVNWAASNDRGFGSANSTTSNVDAINRTIPGTSQIIPDNRLGVGVRTKFCFLCDPN